MVAVQMATINGAEACHIDDRVGLIAPGRIADILIVDDLDDFRLHQVIANGRLVAQDGALIDQQGSPPRTALLTGSFPLDPVAPDDLVVRAGTTAGRVSVLAFDMTDQIFVRKRRDVVLRAENGVVPPDPDQDVLYVTVVERYGRTDKRPVAFVSGFGLRSGALATSTAPEVVEFLELPIGGIVADLEPEGWPDAKRGWTRPRGASDAPSSDRSTTCSSCPSPRSRSMR